MGEHTIREVAAETFDQVEDLPNVWELHVRSDETVGVIRVEAATEDRREVVILATVDPADNTYRVQRVGTRDFSDGHATPESVAAAVRDHVEEALA